MKGVSIGLLALLLCPGAYPQGRGAGRGGPLQTPRSAAAIDMTGYWVSVVTEDWMFRMVTPPKGQYLGVPLNAAARRVADTWDPAKDEAAGEQCKSYGVAAVMRIPGRLHVTWDNDVTLKIDTEAGTQTRLLHFSGEIPKNTEPSWQGYSVAEWEQAAVGRGQPRNGDLKVVTTRLLPGYLRKNGVPYSENAIVTEWYDLHRDPSGTWLVVSTEVKDPQYLAVPLITSTHFKKLPDNAPWKPEACSSR